MSLRSIVPVLLAFSTLCACVPKTQFEDQQAKLKEAQSKLKSMEDSNVECDKDSFLQLKEQAQSLDLLTQELVTRNSDLSKEVARLRVYEAASKNENVSCAQKIEAEKRACDSKVERTR